ncbi:MAG: hypothetical protein SGI77_02495 [Pirellulaceae bacterium]|nr:hypothetical protein [Pirellulaceae bacterium]
MKKNLLALLALGSLLAGCASIEDYKYRSVNRSRAAQAWRQAKVCLPADCTTIDYANGFKDGYFAVATGGSCCPPVVPPPCYFHARYQSTEGQAKVNQWYQGYQAGTVAADRDGRSLWSTVPTQDGPGLNCQAVELTTDTYWSNVIANPTVSDVSESQ